jgi:hypothetical protein
MAQQGVKMIKDNGGVEAVAHVPADAVAIWEADGWKVAQEAKAKK